MLLPGLASLYPLALALALAVLPLAMKLFVCCTLKSTSAEQWVLQLLPAMTCHTSCSACRMIQRQRFEYVK